MQWSVRTMTITASKLSVNIRNRKQAMWEAHTLSRRTSPCSWLFHSPPLFNVTTKLSLLIRFRRELGTNYHVAVLTSTEGHLSIPQTPHQEMATVRGSLDTTCGALCYPNCPRRNVQKGPYHAGMSAPALLPAFESGAALYQVAQE